MKRIPLLLSALALSLGLSACNAIVSSETSSSSSMNSNETQLVGTYTSDDTPSSIAGRSSGGSSYYLILNKDRTGDFSGETLLAWSATSQILTIVDSSGSSPLTYTFDGTTLVLNNNLRFVKQ